SVIPLGEDIVSRRVGCGNNAQRGPYYFGNPERHYYRRDADGTSTLGFSGQLPLGNSRQRYGAHRSSSLGLHIHQESTPSPLLSTRVSAPVWRCAGCALGRAAESACHP